MKLQKSLIQFLCLFAFWGMISGNASAFITIDSVYVGDIGNPNDPTTGYGAVDYGYSIGKYEVTLNQYCAFLNAVGRTDTYGLYNTSMGSNPAIMGISRSGSSGSYTYSVIGSGARPVTYVSWYDSARFVNWLQNGQPTGLQAAGTTETGAYTLTGNSGIITRNANATYGLPSANESYEAAHYQPANEAGDSDGYWLYATRSNIQPNSRNGSTTDPNSANYYWDDYIDNGFNGGFAVTQSHWRSPSDPCLTDVGAFTLASSYYGTFDQTGNVGEWNDRVYEIQVDWRGVSGGEYTSTVFDLGSFYQDNQPPTTENAFLGFRTVIIPEPGTFALAALGATALLIARRRK